MGTKNRNGFDMTHSSRGYDAHLVRYATYASVSVASILIAVKLGAWLATDAVSLQATLIDSLLDAAASLINLFAVRRAQRPATDSFRFGHGKAEAIAALGQSMFIAGSACWLLFEATQRLFSPHPVVETQIGVSVMVIAMAITLGLILFQQHVVKRTNSAAIRADSIHYRSDFLINGGVIVSLLGASWYGFSWLDPLTGGIIALYIVYTAWAIASEAFAILMDRELPEEIRRRIVKIAKSHPEARGVHELRTRTSGLQSFIQFHLELDDEMTLARSHEISDEIEELILKEFPHSEVIIHQDPKGFYEAHRRAKYEQD
jgi:ferrous-iron efflux pump FieF